MKYPYAVCRQYVYNDGKGMYKYVRVFKNLNEAEIFATECKDIGSSAKVDLTRTGHIVFRIEDILEYGVFNPYANPTVEEDD